MEKFIISYKDLREVFNSIKRTYTGYYEWGFYNLNYKNLFVSDELQNYTGCITVLDKNDIDTIETIEDLIEKIEKWGIFEIEPKPVPTNYIEEIKAIYEEEHKINPIEMSEFIKKVKDFIDLDKEENGLKFDIQKGFITSYSFNVCNERINEIEREKYVIFSAVMNRISIDMEKLSNCYDLLKNEY